MAALYIDENFDARACRVLASLGHDVLTVRESGLANLRTSDAEVLEYAHGILRAVVTINRKDFRKLHGITGGAHSGIIICTEDRDFTALALRIDAAIEAESGELAGKLISVVRPG